MNNSSFIIYRFFTAPEVFNIYQLSFLDLDALNMKCYLLREIVVSKEEK